LYLKKKLAEDVSRVGCWERYFGLREH